MEALHEYDAWKTLREAGDPLSVGDLLETEDGRLRVCKYVGFEPAEWVVPEAKQAAGPASAPDPGGQTSASGQASASSQSTAS